jgi:membrane associated rhomboid family serine protease
MRGSFAIPLVWIAAIVFFNTIIGVFGIQAALAGLVVFVALACVLAARSQRSEGRQ